MDALKGFTTIKQDDEAAFAKSILLQFFGVLLPIFVAVVISVIVTNLYGCQAETQPTADTQPRNMIIIKKGTMVGNHRTQSDGVYLSSRTAAKLIQKITALEAAAKGNPE